MRWRFSGCSVFVTLFMERIGYRITMFLILGFLFGVMERIKLWQVLTLTAGSFPGDLLGF